MTEKQMAGFGPGGGWVLTPPVSRKDAERETGMDIPEPAWQEIHKAFALYGRRLDALTGFQANHDKNNLLSFAAQKTKTERRLASAIKELDAIPRGFLDEAADNLSITKTGGGDSFNLRGRLAAALVEMDQLAAMIRDAEPIPRETPTEATARIELAQAVFATLKPYGATLSNGWTAALEEIDDYADLTPFERLVKTLGIHDGAPRNTVHWLRETAQVAKHGR